MTKILPTLTLIAATLFAPVISHADEGTKMSEDHKNVLNTIQTMTTEFHAGNLDGVMQSYENNAAVAFEPGKPVLDRAMLEQGFAGFFTVKPKFTYSGHEVIVAGDIALHIAPWKMQGTTPDGQSMEQSGLSVAVLRKQEDGKWLMVIDNPHGQHLLEK